MVDDIGVFDLGIFLLQLSRFLRQQFYNPCLPGEKTILYTNELVLFV